MEMMLFIYSLPVINVKLLPEDEQSCSLCEEVYFPMWKINGEETAIILPCGHIIGHFCIRKWLSPYEGNQSSCPILGCGATYPPPRGTRVPGKQLIVGGKLRPRPFRTASGYEGRKDAVRQEGEEEEDDVDQGSVVTEEMINELADDTRAFDIDDQDSIRQIRATSISPATDDGFEHEDFQAASSAAIAKAREPKTPSKWGMVRNALKTLYK